MKLLAAAMAACAAPAEAACRLALVLALDVSGSVDAAEYRLQLEGIAAAFEHPAVQDALFSIPDAPIAVSVFEWSGQTYQRVIQPWSMLARRSDLAGLTQRLRGWQRPAAPETTALGAALRAGAVLMSAAPECWRRVIDVSGDGRNNNWPDPRSVRRSGVLNGITVNALVIGADGTQDGEGLVSYFRAEILNGSDAFLEEANGYGDYTDAMTRKLLRELSAPPMGTLDRRGRKVARRQ